VYKLKAAKAKVIPHNNGKPRQVPLFALVLSVPPTINRSEIDNLLRAKETARKGALALE
jgi:hypothetical protein